MDNAIDELKVIIEAEIAPYKKQLEEMVKETNKMAGQVDRETKKVRDSFSRMGRFVKSTIVALGIAKIGKESLELASDVKETEGVVSIAFGNMRKYADDFAKESLQNYGMSSLSAKQAAADYMLMSQGMGYVGEEAAKMAVNVTKLSADMAALKNTSQEQAKIALNAIWTGETQALKRYGIVMTQANLEQYAQTKGINQNIQSMTQQEQLMLRYSYVMNSMSAAHGQFQREQQGWAAQNKILGEQFKELLIIIGEGLMKVFLPVLRFINIVMGHLIALAKTVSQVFGKLFGSGGITEDVAGVSDGIAQSLGGINDDLSDIGSDGAKAMRNLGKEADKAGKKAKGSLASFDKLNVLSSPSSESATPGAGGSPLTGMGGGINIPMPAFSMGKIDVAKAIDTSGVESVVNGIIDKFRPFIDTIRSIDLQPIINAFIKLWESIKPYLALIGDGIAWVFNKIIGPFAKWFTEKLAPVAIEIIAEVLNLLYPIIEKVAQYGGMLWDNFLAPIAGFTADVFIWTMEKIRDLLKAVGEWMREHPVIIEVISAVITGFAAAWIAVKGAIAAVKTAAEGWVAVVKIGAGVSKVFGAAIGFLTSPIGITIAAIGAIIAIILLLVKNWDKVKEVAAKVWQGIKDIWGRVARWFSDRVIEPLRSFFGNVWSFISDTAKGAWQGIKNVFGGVWRWFTSNVTDPIANVFTNLWEGIKSIAANTWNGILSLFTTGGEIFSGIVGSIADIFRNIVNFLISGINSVIAWPFKNINSFLNFIKDISIMGFRPFQNFWGYNPVPIPQIPHLDVGTNYVQKSGLAMIHEGEAVVPKKYNPAYNGRDNREQIELLKEQNKLLRKLLEKDEDIYLDGDKITSNVNKINKKEYDRFGYAY